MGWGVLCIEQEERSLGHLGWAVLLFLGGGGVSRGVVVPPSVFGRSSRSKQKCSAAAVDQKERVFGFASLLLPNDDGRANSG